MAKRGGTTSLSGSKQAGLCGATVITMPLWVWRRQASNIAWMHSCQVVGSAAIQRPWTNAARNEPPPRRLNRLYRTHGSNHDFPRRTCLEPATLNGPDPNLWYPHTSMMLATANLHLPVLPAWIALALTVMLGSVVWWHARSLFRSDIPPSRHRIRLANAAVTMLLAPVLGLSFGVVHPGMPELWVMCWSVAIALLAITILLAMLDTANNVRLHHAERRDLQAGLAAARATMRHAASAASSALHRHSPDSGPRE